MLDRVKLALRISHNALDMEILETISAARSEMVRAGVPESVAAGDSSLVTMAVKTYCLSVLHADQKVREGYAEAFKYQLDNIRKSDMGELANV